MSITPNEYKYKRIVDLCDSAKEILQKQKDILNADIIEVKTRTYDKNEEGLVEISALGMDKYRENKFVINGRYGDSIHEIKKLLSDSWDNKLNEIYDEINKLEKGE